MKHKCLAIIPARGGSKGLKGKNIKKLKGVPLLCYTIQAARASKNISRTVVSTDDPRIAAVAHKYGSDVIIRPKKLAKDLTPMEDVVLHCLSKLKKREGYVPSLLILLQPTSPLRKTKDIDNAVDIFNKKRCDATISVFEPSNHPLKSFILNEKGFLRGLISHKYSFTPRQALPKCYIPNGAIFLIKTGVFLKKRTFFPSKTVPYFMPVTRSIDIDNKFDFEYASYLLEKNCEDTFSYLRQ